MKISFLNIQNFRSLKDVSIANIGEVSFFYGLNNCGKSNILAAIEAILSSKVLFDPVESSGGNLPGARKSDFHEGRIPAFSNNFYFNTPSPITFEIGLTFEDSELKPYKSILEAITPRGAKGAGTKARLKLGDGHAKTLKVSGRFDRVDSIAAEAVPVEMVFNDKFVIFQLAGGKPSMIPNVPASLSIEDRAKAFRGLCNLITDSFLLIGADRFISGESFKMDEDNKELTSKSLKRWLFELSTSASNFEKFKEVEAYFSEPPFRFGSLSFNLNKSTGDLDIMVEQRGHSLPLERLGSGLQQVLYLVSQIVANKNKIIGIEELEINLSPESQKIVSEVLKKLVLQKKSLHQVLVTSHSPYFRGRGDVGSFDISYDETQKATLVQRSAVRSFRTRFSI